MTLFPYTQKEMDHLCSRDPKLARVIEHAGFIERPMYPSVFDALVHLMGFQQVSPTHHAALCTLNNAAYDYSTPEQLLTIPDSWLLAQGLVPRRVQYLRSLANAVQCGRLDLESLADKSEKDIRSAFALIDGVGPWTVDMVMLFALGRPNILSYYDSGIRKGLMLLHDLPEMNLCMFGDFKRMYEPYGSVAAFYLWSIAGVAGK